MRFGIHFGGKAVGQFTVNELPHPGAEWPLFSGRRGKRLVVKVLRKPQIEMSIILRELCHCVAR